MTPENLAPALQKLEASEPRLEPAKSQSKGNEVANGSNGNSEPQQALALINALKADLKQAGLAKPETQEKVLQLEKWAQNLSSAMNGDKSAIATEEHRKRQRQWLSTLASQMRASTNLDTLFKTTLTEVRQHLQVDRALIYQFQTENQGVVLAESMVAGYTPSLGESLSAIAFGVPERLDYQHQQVVILDRTLPKPLSPYQLQLLQQFQVKGSLTLPIFLEGQVWGLLSLMQCSNSRAWRETEISLLYQVVSELTLALQSVESSEQMQKQAEQAKVISKAIDKIRQSFDLDTLFKTTAREVRQLLSADRVGVFRFYPGSGFDDGEFVSEDVNSGYSSAVAAKVHDHCFGQQYAAHYAQGRVQAVADIYNAQLSDCHIEILAQFQVRANLIVPLLIGSELWGLLCIHQCSSSREWQKNEIDFAKQIAAQFSVALQQAEYLQQLQEQSTQITKTAERERAVAKVIDKIRKSLEINTIFKTVTQEVRELLQAERVVVYRFETDWSGEFVAESVGSRWTSLMQEQIDNPLLRENISECSAKILA
ncbi:MAG: GAF domain-containing protein, partial [Microcoleus sp. SIO2G3]|nr:GAF domain-containing protein [Microcoleus sp. SIO2G3]